MSIATEKVGDTFLSISTGVAIPCDWPLYAEDEVVVIYGKNSLEAIFNVDYTVTLDAPNYNQFTVTPLASLLTKINNLIAADATETNYVTIRRKLDYLTSVQPETVRYTAFLSREIERMHMRFQQIAEEVYRAVVVPVKNVGSTAARYFIDPPVANRVLIWDSAAEKLTNGPDVTDLAAFEAAAANATADAAAAESAMVRAEAAAAMLPKNNYTATTNPTVGDGVAAGYSVGSQWVNITSGNKFLCVSATLGAADWRNQSADLSSLGTAAYSDASEFATAAQGALADTAVQPGDLIANKILHLQHQELSGVSGGTASPGARRKININTVVTDSVGTTLTAGQFTLPAGTYRVWGAKDVYAIRSYKTWLRNVTDDADVLIGTSGYISDGVAASGQSLIKGEFSIASEKTFEYQYQTTYTRAATGLGVASGLGTEVFADLFIIKVA